ncbi:hypothetical protein PQX77_018562 [Marasmius sp. AFHP31]|nr:hypothetical protein PQX77_018562 [Marasmius sp. AFHP31]
MACSLTFKYKPGQLSKDVDMILTFGTPPKDTSRSFAAWHIAKLKSIPDSVAVNEFNVKYSGKLGFSVAQVDTRNIITSGSMVEVKPGQATDLTLSGSEPSWSVPSGTSGELVRATNKTGLKQNIAFGIVEEGKGGYNTLSPTFVFQDVEDTKNIEVAFKPILKIYVSYDFKENDFFTGGLVSDEPIWTGNLAALAPAAKLAFAEEAEGEYRVNAL